MKKLSRSTGLRLTGVAVAGAALLAAATGPSVFAGLKATASAPGQTASTGTLKLALDGTATFSQSVSDMAPGDNITRYLTLQNTGALAAKDIKMQVVGTGDASLNSGAKQLKVTVSSCDTAFSSGTCAGGEKSQISATGIDGLGSYVAFSNSPVMAPVTGALYLKVVVSLPDTDEVTADGVFPTGTIQGKSTSLAYTFQTAQRAVVTS